MAVFAFVFASLAALFSSFLSLSPTGFDGLGPWMATLGTRPVAPTPVAFPKAFLSLEFWEAIPTANLSASDIVVPPPKPTFSFVLEEEVGGQAFAEPQPEQPEEPTVEGLLKGLWWLVKMSLLCLTLNVNEFIREHWPLGPPKVSWSRVYWLIWPTRLLHSGDRGRLAHCHARRTSKPARGVAAVVASQSAISPPSTIPPPSSPPSPLSALVSPAPLVFRPLGSPPLLALPPPAISPSARAPELPSSSGDQSRLESVERSRWYTKRREQQRRIFELEDEVAELKARIEKMESGQSGPVPAATATDTTTASKIPRVQPVFVTGTALADPPPPSLPSAQLRLSASSALPSTPPPPPPPHYPKGPTRLSAGSAPFYPRPPGYRSTFAGFTPPPLAPQQQRPSLGPQGYGRFSRPDQLSVEEFQKKYPQTGNKKPDRKGGS